jgi:hypothetical protein
LSYRIGIGLKRNWQGGIRVNFAWGKISEAVANELGGQREALLLWIPVFLGLGSALYFDLAAEPSFTVTGGWSVRIGQFLGGYALAISPPR